MGKHHPKVSGHLESPKKNYDKKPNYGRRIWPFGHDSNRLVIDRVSAINVVARL